MEKMGEMLPAYIGRSRLPALIEKAERGQNGPTWHTKGFKQTHRAVTLVGWMFHFHDKWLGPPAGDSGGAWAAETFVAAW